MRCKYICIACILVSNISFYIIQLTRNSMVSRTNIDMFKYHNFYSENPSGKIIGVLRQVTNFHLLYPFSPISAPTDSYTVYLDQRT